MIEAIGTARPATTLAPIPVPAPVLRPIPTSALAAPDRLVALPPPQPTYDYTTNNKTNVYFDPPAIYQAMDALLASAQRSIKMDFYILGGRQAMRMAETLARKAAAGVRVQVIVDPGMGTLPEIKKQMTALVSYLKANGVQVVKANLVDLPPLLRQKDRGVIDHNKLIVVDDRQAMIGGMNLANEFDTFHDVMVTVEGPAAQELGQQFDYDFFYALHPQERPGRNGQPLLEAGLPLSLPGLATVRVNSTGVNRQTHRASILESLQRARQSIAVSMLELGDDEILDALIMAHNRGVRVRVLLDPGEYDDMVPIIRKAPRYLVNSHAVHRLKQAGIDVNYFETNDKQTILHQKMAIVDGRTLLVGSTNWTLKAIRFNSETSLEIHGSEVPARALAQFDKDWATQSLPARKPGPVRRLIAWVYNYFL